MFWWYYLSMNDSPLVFPHSADRERLEKYKHYDLLFDGDHFDAFSIKTGGDVNKQYKKLRYITANFAGLMSKVMADMLFGENITWDFEDNKNQEYVDALIHQNDFINQLYESALINSRRGGDVFKIRIGKRNPLDPYAKPEIIIEQVGADIYFPQFDSKAGRNVATQDIIATTFKQDSKTYLHKETHQPGTIYHEVFEYDPRTGALIANLPPEQFGFKPVEETKIKRSLVFHIPNYRDGKFWGPSDYKDLESLFFAVNNRLTKTDNILDKHSDPILAVPPGVIDEEGKVKKEALGMFEVDNENPGFNKPEYIVWNANLEAAEKEVDKLLELLMLFSETSPGLFGLDKAGIAESGRALKFKLLSTIRKRNRKISYYDMAIKQIITTAMELSGAWGIGVDNLKPSGIEIPTLKWGDGVINDMTEMVEITTQRIDNGTMSRADGIAYLDEISPDKAKEKVKEIDEEDGTVVPDVNNNTSGNTGNEGGSGPSGTTEKPGANNANAQPGNTNQNQDGSNSAGR